MRRLNSKEMEFCDILYSRDRSGINFLEKLFWKELPQYYGEVSLDNKTLMLWRDNTKETDSIVIHSEANRIAIETIVIAVKLLTVLEKEGLIILYKNGSDESPVKIGSGKIDITKGRGASSVIDREIIEMLIKYYRMQIIVTDEFDDFKENGYVTKSDRLKHTEINNSTIALKISAIAVLVSAVAILVDSCGNPSKQDFDKLRAAVDSIRNQKVNVNIPIFRPRYESGRN